jgi:hypothetical protein
MATSHPSGDCSVSGQRSALSRAPRRYGNTDSRCEGSSAWLGSIDRSTAIRAHRLSAYGLNALPGYERHHD